MHEICYNRTDMSRLDSTTTIPKMTVEEYLEFEKNSEEKHDYIDGYLVDVRAMAGTTANHSRIQRNWLTALSRRLEGNPCEAFGSDLKVRSIRQARYRYPDVSVGCRPLEFDEKEGSQRTLLNPKLIIEILSDSTANQDRDDKFKEYLTIESFREYVLTSQHLPVVETFYRNDDGQWVFNYVHGLDATIKLSSLGVEAPLREIYAGVEFSPEAIAEMNAHR